MRGDRLRHGIVLVGVLLIFPLVLLPFPAQAANKDTCTKVGDLLWTLDKVAASDPKSAGSSKMALARLSIKAMAALGAARSAKTPDELPEEMIVRIEAIRDSLAQDDEQTSSDPRSLRPSLLSSGMAVLSGMPLACPEIDLPDLAAHQD